MFNDKKILAMFILLCFVLSTMVAFAPKVQVAQIDEEIPLGEGGIRRAIIRVNWNPDLESIKFNHDAVVAKLKAEAAATQAPILAYLSQKPDAKVLNKFWIDNLILVEADVSTIREVATLSGVSKIISDFTITADTSGEARPTTGDVATADGATWNIAKVRAPDVWATLGLTGEGIKFATTDTGIDITHQDIVGTLFTADPSDPTYPGGWAEFDSAGNWVSGSVPHDTWTHGTATYGLIVGDAKGPVGAVGMAPKAIGSHALTLPGGGGSFPQVVAGLQWVLDPYDADGNHYPMSRVSSHSWGAGGHRSELLPSCNALYAAGHMMCASIGNSGPGSSGSPGNIYTCFGAGSTMDNDYVSSWSSGEYVNWPESWPEPYYKPNVCAPGENVIVIAPGNQYVYWSGTSFSSPHVAGAAVLMLSGNPSGSVDELRSVLQETAVWYNYYYPSRPDIRYGWGRIDALEAAMVFALPQGVRGHVTDATTAQPIAEAKVTAVEAARSVKTNALGYYDMRLLPGTYTVTFSRFGYKDETVPGVVVNPDVFTRLDKALTPVPPGFIAGHVYFEPTMIGIPGAAVKVLDVPVKIEAETDALGAYNVAIPPGTYKAEASSYGFKSQTIGGIVVQEGLTTTVDFKLTQPPKVAVIGDYPSTPGQIVSFLVSQGYTVDAYATLPPVTPKVSEYGAIIVNNPGYTDYASFSAFITATDTNSIGVVWLDSWQSYCGGYQLWYWLGWPPVRYTSYSSAIEYTYYRVRATDADIIPGWNVGDVIRHDIGVGTDHDHAYYNYVWDGYYGGIGTVKIVAAVGYRYGGYNYDYPDYYLGGLSEGIIKVNRDAGNKWVLLSMHANTPWTGVPQWAPETKDVFKNSINWVSPAAVPHAKFVVFHLTVEPEVGTWYVPRTASVGVKNVGAITGTYKLELYVDSTLEGTATDSLIPGEYEYPSWTVQRFDIGTYTAKVRHLTAKFVVRAPRITVEAHELDKNKPLAGADVYGYYKKYAGPGYFKQWSQAYGGYGHSQFAQPVGDLDNDGMNEIIVGGYETPGYGMCRILSYNVALGTYIQEYSWTHGGGTYNSPSGATMLDLDGDGKLELVVSWGYSGSNDGVWAYKWDGANLKPLDHWYGGFVFDVYSCDYDADGVKEVLVANAPWGATYAHVVALGWDKAAGKFVVETTFLHPWYTWYECMMLWSGDVNNDGKTEVVISLAYSGSYNGGTWALNYDPATGTWTYTLVYDALINGGTHYGVVVGDVDGDGTPEIGIGNNNPSYIGAGAVLIEWDGSAYKKVWEGAWPSEYSVIEAVFVGDCDNDGKNEFLAGGGNVHIIGWTGSNYAEEATLPLTGMQSGTIVADCDTDGKNEIKAQDIIGYGPGAETIFKYTPVPTPLPGWTFKYFGTTDQNGMLTFDSPCSVVDMFLFVYRGEKTPLGWQYLLTKYLYVQDDTTVVYTPTSATEAIITSRLNARGLELFQHMGITWLQYDNIPVIFPFVAFKTDPAKIVVSPMWYVFRHMLNEIDPYGSWWYYFMNPNRIAMLNGGDKYDYSYAGPIKGFVKHTQSGSDVTINWNAEDSFGHEITGISVDEVSWLSSGTSTYLPVPIEPSMLQDVETMVGKTVDYYPLIALYDKKAIILTSGYVQWYEKTATITLSKQVSYAILSFVAGPYGNPNAKMYVYLVKEA